MWTSTYVRDTNAHMTCMKFVGLYSTGLIDGQFDVQGLFEPINSFTSK